MQNGFICFTGDSGSDCVDDAAKDRGDRIIVPDDRSNPRVSARTESAAPPALARPAARA
jgi:hypothetical protein